MKQFVAGFALATVLVGAAGAWLIKRVNDQPVRWPMPLYYEYPGAVPESGGVHASGTLIGDDMTGGTYIAMDCDGDTKLCRINELSSHGSFKQVFLFNDVYPITTWTDDQIVAESNPPATACNSVRMVVDRVAKVTHYYRLPNKRADRKKCDAIFSKNKVFDWTLGDQPI